MPRHVIVLSSSPDLFSLVREILRDDARFLAAGDLLHCDGSLAPLTNIYPVQMGVDDWDNWTLGGGDMPDPRSLSALLFECGSPGWVSEVGKLLAVKMPTPVWFVDSADVAWLADRVDPERIMLG